jgi:hypothetical protein
VEATAESWIGDDSCDDGTFGIDLTCPAFDDDGGDCAPEVTCGDYTGLSFNVNKWIMTIDPLKEDGTEWDWTGGSLSDEFLAAVDAALAVATKGVWLPGTASAIRTLIEAETGSWELPDVTAYQSESTIDAPEWISTDDPIEFGDHSAVLDFGTGAVEFEDTAHEFKVLIMDRDLLEADPVGTWYYSAELFRELAGCGAQEYTFSDEEMTEGGHRIRVIEYEIEAAP